MTFPIQSPVNVAKLVEAINQLHATTPVQRYSATLAEGVSASWDPETEGVWDAMFHVTAPGAFALNVVPNNLLPGSRVTVKNGLNAHRAITVSFGGETIDNSGSTAVLENQPYGDLAFVYVTKGEAWVTVGRHPVRSPHMDDVVFFPQEIAADMTVPETHNALSVGPVRVQDGVTVTVTEGSRYVVA